MTATSAGTCLITKGLDISLAALRRQDPYIDNIVDVASQVALYTFNNRTNEWEKTEVEGTLFVYTRLASPRNGFTIMNRLSMENLTEPITKELDFQLQDPFLLYRNARLVIHGIWFYDKQDCQRIAQRMKILTQQEQAFAQSQGEGRPPVGEAERGGGGGGGGAGGAKPVDILQMLTKARSEYDKGGKSSSEPKEIGGSSMLHGNPHLIKPIPVKPNTQDGGGGEPRSLSLATLFGSQLPYQPLSPITPAPPTGMGPAVSSRKPGRGRPAVARSLSYDQPAVAASSGAPEAGQGPAAVLFGSGAVMKGQTAAGVAEVFGEGQGGAQPATMGPITMRGSVVVAPGSPYLHLAGVAASPTNPQHCPAIQKLIQGPLGPGGAGGSLQTLSESPENRLCENGLPLEHHHHLLHHHVHHQRLHQHHHLHDHQLQYQHGQHLHVPIQRLFQAQTRAPSGPPCCSNAPPLQQPPLTSSLQIVQPITVESVTYPHPQHNQPITFSPCNTETQPSSQSTSGGPVHMPGVAPHELLQKLQLVQQEQNRTSHDAPRHGPGLAPRFQGAAPTQDPGLALGLGSGPGNKDGMQFPVVSPQCIPGTLAPTLLLSPSVFSQAKPSTGGVRAPQDSCSASPSVPRPPPPPQEEPRVLSRRQLQAALLHLVQTDGSFIDSIYEAYVCRLAQDPM